MPLALLVAVALTSAGPAEPSSVLKLRLAETPKPKYGRVHFLSIDFGYHAHLVQPQSGEELHYSLDGEQWRPMREAERPFLRAVFEAELDRTR